MHRLLRLLVGRGLSPVKRYGTATLAVFAAAGFRALVPIPGLPFLFFIPALMGVALALGRGPGFFATALSVLLAAYLYVDPPFSLALSGQGWLATLVFGGVGLGVVAFCDALAASRMALAESESFLRSVLGASADCIKVLDLDAKLTFMSEGGQRVMEVGDFNAIKGCPWPDFWKNQGHEEAKAAVAAARAGGRGHFRGAADTMAGSPKHWDVQVTPIFGLDGRPEKLLSVSRDVTAMWTAEEALRDSEAHWRGLFEHLREGIIVGELIRDAQGCATDWRYLDVNPAWGDLVGIAPEKTIGTSLRTLIPGIEEAWVTDVVGAVDTGTPAVFARQVGVLGRWYEGRIFPLVGDRFAILFQDITERHKVGQRRDALIALDDLLRDLEEAGEIASRAVEIVGRTLGADRVGYGTFSADGEDMEVLWDWTSPGIDSVVGRYRMRDYGSYVNSMMRGEVVVIDDARLDDRTTSHVAALASLSIRALLNVPLMEGGRLLAMIFVNATEPHAWSVDDVAFVSNVAERTRSVVERRRAEQRLRNLAVSLEHQVEERTRDRDRLWRMPDLLLAIAGFDATILAVNPAWTTLLGWREDELVGRCYADFIHSDDAERSLDWAARYARGEKVEALENRYRHKDGGYLTIGWTITLGDEAFHCAGRDISEEKERAAERARLEEQLRQSQKMEAVGQLTGGLAHDFNNLLTGVIGSLELMETRIGQGRLKDVDRYVNAAQGAAKRAAALTHRLLAFSRRQTLDPKPTDVNRLVTDIEELVRRTVGPEIAVEMVGAIGLWPTLVDPPQLENALLNLCINARDAMPGGGRITVETANKWLDERAARERELPPGQYVSLCVTDTGTGMTPEIIARVFDPFFTTKPLGQGTGLGLSMIYGFTRQSGGQVRVYSEVGQGTTICLYLPRHYGEGAEEVHEVGLAEAPRAEQGETMLVVDDEAVVRMLVTEVLEDLGYTAVEAADGAGGMKVLRSDARIDLLVTDVGLPGGMNGRQVADAAREVRPELKVLFITGYAENAVLGNGYLEPGMQVLTKPFVMETLASRIKVMISG